MQKLILYILALPLAGLFNVALVVRHLLYNIGIVRSHKVDIPTICVGNLVVGGTGKTPHTLLITSILRQENIVCAILSRGYGRSSSGFRYVETTDSVSAVGDEPLLMKRRVPEVVVAVCKNRLHAIRRIRADYPDIQAIVLDDAFQYRKLNAGLNLLLTTYSRLITRDFLLPLGRLRDLRSRRYHADIVVTTKCPHAMQPIDYKVLLKNLKLLPYQRSYCTQYRYLPLRTLSADSNATIPQNSPVIVLAGIGSPQDFLTYVKKTYNVVHTMIFGDHHRFGTNSTKKIRQAMHDYENSVVITTEKDAMRLCHCGLQPSELSRIVYLPIEIVFLKNEYVNFSQIILNYVKTNKRISIFC